MARIVVHVSRAPTERSGVPAVSRLATDQQFPNGPAGGRHAESANVPAEGRHA
jgi:hypothetical protein